MMNNMASIVDYCAAEVERQQASPKHVGHMFRAWEHARCMVMLGMGPNEKDIQVLNGIIEGSDVASRYRLVSATFANGQHAIAAEHIPRQMELLIKNRLTMSVDEFVKAFLDIHPFNDGNGRTASLLYNMLWRNIDNPVVFPEYY